nr:retrovirus-related Pol polyprotein from transposon TNT 1-94 [Tanacetum cinerariifolium]
MAAVNDVPHVVDKKGDIYRRFVYEDNLIQKRNSDTKKALITTPSSTAISTAFFSNNVIQDFQENSDDEVDERSSEECLRDLDIKYHERALLANSKCFIKRRNNFSGYGQEMVPKTKDWVERLSPDNKLPNFNTGRILVPESQVVNESLKYIKTLNMPESSKYFEAKSLTPLPSFKNLQGASPSLEILKAKAKLFPPCTYCGFNDHRPGDCRNYPECGICGSYDHFTSGHNRVIHIKGAMLAESSQSGESSIGVKCNTYGSTVHSTTNHNEFDHFKRGEKIQVIKAREPTKK